VLHNIILGPKRYIIITLENDRSPRDHLELGPSSSLHAREPLQSSPRPSSSLPACSHSPQEPCVNLGEASSSDHDDDTPPNSPQQPLARSSRVQSFRSVQPPKKKWKWPAKKSPRQRHMKKQKGL
jgi:hypothetical protein